VFRSGGKSRHFITGDFLHVLPDTFPCKFDVILGNPPYVRHHLLSEKPTRAQTVGNSTVELARTSSYWAYFVVHALNFLTDTARMAVILPASFLFADYSLKVRSALTTKFRRLYFLPVKERLFEDTQEISVLLLGETAKFGKSEFRIGAIAESHSIGLVLKD